MKQTSYRSYTVRNSGLFSDGAKTGHPHFTSDLAKCPNCKAILFLHNIWAKKEIELADAGNIKDIQDPDRADIIKALKQNLAKGWQEEKQIREILWRNLNEIVRNGNGEFTDQNFPLWKDNCVALLPLMRQTLEEILKKKDSNNYDDRERGNCLIMIAELYRNLENYKECMKLINQLGSDWDWMKDQYAWECLAENRFTFEFLSKYEMGLEKLNNVPGKDYYERGRTYFKRKHFDKALCDFNKAESLNFNSLNIIDKCTLFQMRSSIYKQKGNLSAALADINSAIEIKDTSVELYALRSKIQEELGNTDEAQWDHFKEELLQKVLYTAQSSPDPSMPFAELYNYQDFLKLRKRIYSKKHLPIRDVISKEDWVVLACVLAREEDYEQLERYASEGLPLNDISPFYFRYFKPTPIYYITTHKIWLSMKDPVKMLRWLISHGADINKAAGDKSTPLGNHCTANGNYSIMKALLENGANPNVETYDENQYFKPLAIVEFLADYESNNIQTKYALSDEDIEYIQENFTKEEIENCKKLASLLREFGAEEISDPIKENNKYNNDKESSMPEQGQSSSEEKDKLKEAEEAFKCGKQALAKKDFENAVWELYKASRLDHGNKKYHKAFADALLKRGYKPMEEKDAAKAEELFKEAKKCRELIRYDMKLEAFLLGHLEAGFDLRTEFIISVWTSPEGNALNDLLVKANYPPALCAVARDYSWGTDYYPRDKKKSMELYQIAADLGYEPAKSAIENTIRQEQEEIESMKEAKEFAKNFPPLQGAQKKKYEEELAALLRPLAKRTTFFNFVKNKKIKPAQQIITSHVGGFPYFEEGGQWYYNKKGEPYEFIFQVFQNEIDSIVLPEGVKLFQLFYNWENREEHIVLFDHLNMEKAVVINNPSEDVLNYHVINLEFADMLPYYEYIKVNVPEAAALAEKLHPRHGDEVYERVRKSLGFERPILYSYLGGYHAEFDGYGSSQKANEEIQPFFQIYLDDDDANPFGWGRFDDAMLYAFYNIKTKKIKIELDINYD
ncbi:MAG: ankyrin repeat domain-containing protein [Treponema sp.]|nr:ankyrin repeat domain-containing protein [Treponema sp.]MCL2250759.1 ankyrin repeat domain-containing protein [Treponema sp.]